MTTGCESPHPRGCEFANAAAERAVKKTFAILGVDVERPEQVKAFQDSLRFSERLRNVADKGAMVFWGAVAAAFAGALWLGIKSKITGGP